MIPSRLAVILVLTGLASHSPAQTYTWSTLAGSPGAAGSSDGTSSAARFRFSPGYVPDGLAVDGAGNVYVADSGNHTIRKVTSAGAVSTFAGAAGVSGSVDGSGSSARFNAPSGLALDAAGNLFVADSANHTVRRITPGGVVTTLAGRAGAAGSIDATGEAARFDSPAGVAVDSNGNVYVADANNYTVRRITSIGAVTTVAGTAGRFGHLDGTGATAELSSPLGLALDAAGNLFVAEVAHVIRRITTSASVATWAGQFGQGETTDGAGSAARFTLPRAVAVDRGGTVFVADGSNTIRRITPEGVVTTVSGSPTRRGSANGTGFDASFNGVSGIAIDAAGNLYVVDSGNSTVRKGVPSAATPSSRLTNLSVRSRAGTGDDTLIVGFSIAGNDSKRLLVRAVGPTLATFGVSGTIPNPSLRVATQAGGLVAENDDWLNSPGMGIAAAIGGATASVGAFPLPEESRDAVVLATLAPGTYTAQVGGGTGIALVEAYDTTGASGARLVNVSARTRTGADGDILIAGFVVAGNAPKNVLIRATGPALAAFGVTGTLADPRLELFTLNGPRVAENDDWSVPLEPAGTATAAALAAASAQAGAFALPAASKDAVLLVALPPGAYTAQVSGVGGTAGVVLVEIYELP